MWARKKEPSVLCSFKIDHFLKSGKFYEIKFLYFDILKGKSQTEPDPDLTKLCGSWSSTVHILLFYFYHFNILLCVIEFAAPFQKISRRLKVIGGIWVFSTLAKKVSVKKYQYDSPLYFYILFRYFVGMDYFSTAIGTLIRYIFCLLLK